LCGDKYPVFQNWGQLLFWICDINNNIRNETKSQSIILCIQVEEQGYLLISVSYMHQLS